MLIFIFFLFQLGEAGLKVEELLAELVVVPFRLVALPTSFPLALARGICDVAQAPRVQVGDLSFCEREAPVLRATLSAIDFEIVILLVGDVVSRASFATTAMDDEWCPAHSLVPSHEKHWKNRPIPRPSTMLSRPEGAQGQDCIQPIWLRT